MMFWAKTRAEPAPAAEPEEVHDFSDLPCDELALGLAELAGRDWMSDYWRELLLESGRRLIRETSNHGDCASSAQRTDRTGPIPGGNIDPT